MNEKIVQLSEDEKQLVVVQLARLKQYESLYNECMAALNPIVGFLCKLHNLNQNEYVLSEDGQALVPKPVLASMDDNLLQQTPVTSTEQ